MKQHRAVITGATGFIGHALCRELLSRGLSVQAICRQPTSTLPEGVEWRVCNLLDRDALTRTLDRAQPDYVYHLAGFTHATRDMDTVGTAFDANLAPTVNLLTAATRVGCQRLVLAGSLEEPDAPDPPSSPYAASKAAGSLYARMFHQLYGTPAVVARIFMVYGPGQRDLRKVVPHSILTLSQDDELKLSSGRRELDWIYIDDVARGLAAMANRTNLDGKTVDLGTGVLTSVRSVVETLVEFVRPDAKPQFGTLPDRAGEHTRRADSDRSAALLDWRAIVPLREGLRATAHFYAGPLTRPAMQPRSGVTSSFSAALFGAGCSSWELAQFAATAAL